MNQLQIENASLKNDLRQKVIENETLQHQSSTHDQIMDMLDAELREAKESIRTMERSWNNERQRLKDYIAALEARSKLSSPKSSHSIEIHIPKPVTDIEVEDLDTHKESNIESNKIEEKEEVEIVEAVEIVEVVETEDPSTEPVEDAENDALNESINFRKLLSHDSSEDPWKIIKQLVNPLFQGSTDHLSAKSILVRTFN